MTVAIRIAALRPEDHARWLELARGYKAFYQTPTSEAEYADAWQRVMAGNPVRGLGATLEGELAGIAHYVFHASTWAASVCYLQDLFVDPAQRGKGIARRLIEAIAAEARMRGAGRYYWLTQSHNATARLLYDKVARYNDFIRYDHPL